MLGDTSSGTRVQRGAGSFSRRRRQTRWGAEFSRLYLCMILAIFTVVLLIIMVSRQVNMLLSWWIKKLLYLAVSVLYRVLHA